MIGRVKQKLIGTLVLVQVGDKFVEAVGRVRQNELVELVPMACFRVPVAMKISRIQTPASEAASLTVNNLPQERPSMSVFRKILDSPKAFDQPPVPSAERACWLHAVLTLADANAKGNDESQSVADEAARRLHVAGVSPFVIERVRDYARILGL